MDLHIVFSSEIYVSRGGGGGGGVGVGGGGGGGGGGGWDISRIQTVLFFIFKSRVLKLKVELLNPQDLKQSSRRCKSSNLQEIKKK